MYGQTEATSRLSYLPPERLADKLGSIGRGLPSTRREVLGADGAPVRPGEVGEIVASGGNVTLGYWNDPQETAIYFRDGRLRTGDLATVDDEGFIFIADRERDFVKVAGNRVAPREVEDVIATLPGVLECAVVGVPDELLGEALRAFVVPVRPGALDAADVLAHCNERLPNTMLPREAVLVGALPRSEAGKLLKARLKADLPAGAGA